METSCCYNPTLLSRTRQKVTCQYQEWTIIVRIIPKQQITAIAIAILCCNHGDNTTAINSSPPTTSATTHRSTTPRPAQPKHTHSPIQPRHAPRHPLRDLTNLQILRGQPINNNAIHPANTTSTPHPNDPLPLFIHRSIPLCALAI